MVSAERHRFDVVCVGDVASDVYLTLAPGRVEVRDDPDRPYLALPLGAKIPYESCVTVEAGGNAANAAVASARLGLRVALAAYLGTDQLGRDLIDALHAEGVASSLIRLDQRVPTNQHFVLRVGSERTILIRHEDFDYHWPHLSPKERPSWLYLSSVGREAHEYEEQIADWLDEQRAVRLAFQPGTFQIERGAVRLARLYRRAQLLVVNRDEAAAIAQLDRSAGSDALLAALQSLGPQQVVITDGTEGAEAVDGDDRYAVPIYPDRTPPLDRTGAGDAFAATLLAFVASGASLEEALLRAPVNAMSVVHTIGTQEGLLDRDELEAQLAAAPEGFRVVRRRAAAASRSPGD